MGGNYKGKKISKLGRKHKKEKEKQFKDNVKVHDGIEEIIYREK